MNHADFWTPFLQFTRTAGLVRQGIKLCADCCASARRNHRIDEPQSAEPLVQTQGRVLKNSPSLVGKFGVVMLAIAFPHAGVGQVCDMVRSTAGASDLAFRPTEAH